MEQFKEEQEEEKRALEARVEKVGLLVGGTTEVEAHA